MDPSVALALVVADLDDKLQTAFAIQLDGEVHVCLAQGHAVVLTFGGYKVENTALQPVLLGSVNGPALESDPPERSTGAVNRCTRLRSFRALR